MSDNPKRPRDQSVSPPPRSPPRQRRRPAAATAPRTNPPSRDPQRRDRDPSPPPNTDGPSRPRRRPGVSASTTALADAQRRQQQREQADRSQQRPTRDVSDFVTQHYNMVPERGREWRKTDSKIKGLRSYNNWVKSCLLHVCARRAGPHAKVLDVGCGKGGDLQKWASQRPHIEAYVGLDPAGVSINQARERYRTMQRRGRTFRAEFAVKDCFGETLEDVPAVREIGFDASRDVRFGGGGFDVVSMMFCMHYAFESEEKARRMLMNVASSLRKDGRFVGVIPNSDVLSAKVEEYHKAHAKPSENAKKDEDDDDDWDPEKTLDTKEPTPEPTADQEPLNWGNTIYKVQFPGQTPKDGVFRPPFGWKYFYFLEEAVEEVPEFVVPWEAFRALAEDYNLELEYRKPFREVWDDYKDDPVLGPLSERMGVRNRDGKLSVNADEMDAASFYHCFSFYKV
jgi:mRNA (guanine-N7-)-methyltransferase